MSHKANPINRNDLPDYDRFANYLAGLDDCTPRTGRSYAQRARIAVDWFTVHRPDTTLLELTPEDIEDYILDMAERGLGSSTRRGAVYALRALYRYLGRRVVNAPNPADRVKAPAQKSKRPDPWSAGELERLLQAAYEEASRHPHGSGRWVRAHFDFAVLATLRYTGLRLSELIGLETAHICTDSLRLEVRNGKGNLQRHSPLPPALAPILAFYLAHVRPHCPASPRLFANPSGYEGSAVYGQVAPRAVFDIVTKYAELAGLPGGAHPHRLRHSYATDLYRRGYGLPLISALLGHRSVLTTIRYIGLSAEDLQRQVSDALPAVDSFRFDTPDEVEQRKAS